MSARWYVVNIGLGMGERATWGPFPTKRHARRWARVQMFRSAWVEDEATWRANEGAAR